MDFRIAVGSFLQIALWGLIQPLLLAAAPISLHPDNHTDGNVMLVSPRYSEDIALRLLRQSKSE